MEFIYQVEVAEFEQRYGVPLSLLTFIAEHHDIPFSCIAVVKTSGEPMIVEGEPFRICRECLESIEENTRELKADEERQRRRDKFIAWVGLTLLFGPVVWAFVIYGLLGRQ
jgi:hypothetical protein